MIGLQEILRVFWGLKWFDISGRGDNWHEMVLEAVKNPALRYWPSSPLATSASYAFYRAANGIFGLDNTESFLVMGYLTGVLYLFFVHLMSKELFTGKNKRLLFIALMTLAGFTRVFVNNNEIMCWAVLITAVYAYASILYLGKKAGIQYPALAYAIGFWTHMSFGWFAPSMLFLIMQGNRKANLEKSLKTAAAFTAVFLIAVQIDLCTEFGKNLWELGYGNLLGGGDGRMVVRSQYMFSPRHLIDIQNEQLFLAFGGVFLLPIIWLIKKPKSDKVSEFLLVMTTFYFIYSMIWNPDYGMPKDWSLFSPLGMPTTALIAYTLLPPKERKQ